MSLLQRGAWTPRATLARVATGLAYAGCVQAQTYVTPSGTYGPGAYTDAFQFFGTHGVIQGGTTIYPKIPYPFGAGGAGLSVAGGGSAQLNPDLGPQPGNIVIQSDYRLGAPNDALYVANGTLTVLGSADPSRITYAMGHGQTVHGIYIPGETGPSIFVGARMYLSADGQDANAIRGYGVYSNATVTDSTLVATGASAGHGIRLWDKAAATLTHSTVSTTGASGHGIFLSAAATAVTQQSSIATQGQGAIAAYVTGAGSSLTMTGGALTTTQPSAHAAYVASGGAFSATDTAIASALGVGVWSLGTQVNLSRGSVSGGSYAAFIQDGATFSANGTSFSAGAAATRGVQSAGSNLDLTDVTVNTTAASNYGVYAYTGGTLQARRLSVNTAGQNGYGIRLVGLASADISGLTVRTSGAGAHGAVFEGGTAAYTGSDFDIATTGGGIGLYAWQKSATTLAGGQIDTGAAANAHGLYITNASVELKSNAQGAGVGVTTGGAGANAAVIGVSGRLDATNASLRARGANAAGLYLFGVTDSATANAIASGSVGTAPDAPANEDGSPGVAAAMATVPSLAEPSGGTEAVTLNSSSVVSDAGSAIRVLGPNATIALNRSAISGVVAFQVQGLTNGGVSSPGVATLNADASTLTGSALTEAGSQSTLNLANGSRWDMTGSSNLSSLGNNASAIWFSPPTAGAFKTLTVGNYAGQNGAAIGLNTYLGADGSPSDRLVIDGGAASGLTSLRITNAGGSGALTVANGIQVVGTVNGASTAASAFVLNNRVVQGPYEYQLFRGTADASDPQGWYLRSEAVEPPPPPDPPGPPTPPAPPTPPPPPPPPPDPKPLFRPEVSAYLSNQRQAAGMFVHSLHDRLGEPQYIEGQTMENQDPKRRSAWLRVVGKKGGSTSKDGNFDVDTRSTLIQGGGDLAQWRTEDAHGRYHLGGMIGYGTTTSDASAALNPARAQGETKGWSVGLYGTWYQNDQDKLGWYTDLWGLYGWYKNAVRGETLPEVKYNADSLSLSGEAGYAAKLRNDWVVEPQAQVIYVKYSEDEIAEPNGTKVSGSRGSGWIARLGVRLHRTWVSESGRKTQPYLTLNWWHDKMHNQMAFNAIEVNDLYPRDRYEAKLGLNADLSKGWTAWGNVGYQWGDQNFRATSLRVGAKYNW